MKILCFGDSNTYGFDPRGYLGGRYPVTVRWTGRLQETGYDVVTEEGCLSLTGTRKTTRYQKIEVEYQNASWKKMKQTFTGLTAGIIQHEVNHL